MMEAVSKIKNLESVSNNNSNELTHYPFEVVVIEDNHLTNTILSKALDSTINTICNLKNISIKFSSFQTGSDFLTYLASKEFYNSKLVVFTDYHLEENMTGGLILKNVKQKNIDATVIVMSDTTNKQISIDTVKLGAYCFLPKNNKTPVICSELLFKFVN